MFRNTFFFPCLFVVNLFFGQITEEYHQCALELFQQQDFRGADDYFTQKIKLNPGDAENYFERALAREKYFFYAGAIDDYTKAISIDTTAVDYYFLRGVMRVKIGDYSHAITDLNKTVSMEADNTDAWLYKGIAHTCLKNYTSALEDYEEAIRQNNSHHDAYLYRGITHFLTGNFSKAENDFQKTTQLDSSDFNGLYLLAFIDVQKKQYQQAIPKLYRAFLHIRNRLTYPELESELLNPVFARENLKPYIHSFNKEMKQMDLPDSAWLSLGLLNQLVYMPEQAIHYYHKIKNSTELPSLYFHQSQSEFAMKDYKSALKSINHYTKAFPFSEAGFIERAALYQKINKPNDALNDLNWVLYLNPQHKNARKCCAEINQTTDHHKLACYNYQQYLYLGGSFDTQQTFFITCP